MPNNGIKPFLKRNGIVMTSLWTFVICLLAALTLNGHHAATIKDAENEARDYFRLNMFYRTWAAKMGGVYVPVDKVTPNPYLTVSNRDITTSNNRQLTLVNPAYMTRMVFESIIASSPDPIINKITSIKPLNPINAPDEWEKLSLEAFERKEYKERSEITNISGKPYLRLISMFVTDETCLKCHAHQGYRIGDIRGAITVSVPLSKRFGLQQDTDRNIIGGYLVLWMLGTISIAISSRRRMSAEETLSESENRYRSLFHKAGEGICIMSQHGDLINVNEAFADDHGYEEHEILGMNIRDIDVHGGVEENPDRAQLLMSGESIAFEVEHYHKNGNVFPLEVKVSLISFGEETFSLCFHRDITERKRLEFEREQYHTFFNISSDLMCVANITGNFIKMNSVWEKTFGYTEEELSSKPFIDFVHPDDVDNTLAVVKNNLLLGSSVFGFENRYRCKDGTYKWLSWTSNPVPEEGITYAIARDISERKQFELEREQFYTFFNNSSDLMCIADPNGAFEKTNPAFTEILGYSKEELISKPFIDFVHPDDKQSTLDEMARQQQIGSSFAFQNRYMCKDGSTRWLSWRADYNKDENITYATARDITDRKKAEEEERERELQLLQTQKLESLGVLSGGIAHDFNNILAIIMGNCSLAKMDAENADKFIPEIEKASERAAELCRQMLAYAGKSQFVQSKVNVRSLVADTISMLKKTVPQNAEIKFDNSDEIPFIQGDASQLSQIVMNLIINASEAIGTEQGEVSVSLSETMIVKDQSDLDYNGKAITPGRYVRLEVADNGCGMDEETKWRIFEPFYTTKFTGRGLGMSAVLGIIMSHKGALQLFSELGKGTTFKVYLPIKDVVSTGKEKHNQTESSVPWQGSGTILFVEDEEQIRPLAKTMLETLGFTVIEAVNGKEALELYHKNVADITIVLTDLGMPIMDGYALFSELKRLDPDLPIIISSGFGEGEVTARIPRFEIAGLINKPYNFSQLQEVLKSVEEDI